MSFIQRERVAHNEKKRIRTREAWDGLNVSIVSEHDAGTAVGAVMVKPELIKLKCINKKTDKQIFYGTLVEWWAIAKAGQNDIRSTLLQTGKHEFSEAKVMQDYSFMLPVYHGDYEVMIDPTTAFQANTKQNSYIEVSFNRTTAPMLQETVYRDETIDKKQDEFAFNGASLITVINTQDMTLGHGEGAMSDLTEFNFTAVEEVRSEDFVGILTNTFHHCENPSEFKAPQLILHAGHILTGGRIELTSETIGNTKIYFVEVHKVPKQAAASEQRQEEKLDETYSRLN